MSLGGVPSLDFTGLPPPSWAREAEEIPKVLDTALVLSPVIESSRSG